MNRYRNKLASGGHPQSRRSRTDLDFIEASTDVSCVGDIADIAKRAALCTSDDMNATEASEERLAAAEAQAMR